MENTEKRKQNKTESMVVLFSPREKQIILAAAQKEGLAFASFLRKSGMIRAAELNVDLEVQ